MQCMATTVKDCSMKSFAQAVGPTITSAYREQSVHSTSGRQGVHAPLILQAATSNDEIITTLRDTNFH